MRQRFRQGVCYWGSWGDFVGGWWGGVFTLYREARKVTESKDEGGGDGGDADISCVQVTGEGVGAGGGSSLRSHVSVQWI